jgi:hypothetical protein
METKTPPAKGDLAGGVVEPARLPVAVEDHEGAPWPGVGPDSPRQY